MGFLFVCLGAAIGAPARYLTDRAIQARHDTVVPWGTMTANVVGSMILGLLIGLADAHHVPEAVMLALGTGFCGALTTYSTFSYETFRLYESGARLYATINVAISLTAGLGAALVGLAVGAAL
ncbi:fluoride efflux transporter CrcB [Nocardioides sp. InS609-2]|uniref:fluoride efflux transporter CrcB n=1 Tax=Nocardioides sp. InS609-2 TaxID=2760705 RepID=UPI0020C04E48|nr:fluoride efflux transporter CrcB [Nocardioides sp. InS609-2]